MLLATTLLQRARALSNKNEHSAAQQNTARTERWVDGRQVSTYRYTSVSMVQLSTIHRVWNLQAPEENQDTPLSTVSMVKKLQHHVQ